MRALLRDQRLHRRRRVRRARLLAVQVGAPRQGRREVGHQVRRRRRARRVLGLDRHLRHRVGVGAAGEGERADDPSAAGQPAHGHVHEPERNLPLARVPPGGLGLVEDANLGAIRGVVHRGDNLAAPRGRRGAHLRGEVRPRPADFHHHRRLRLPRLPVRRDPAHAENLDGELAEGRALADGGARTAPLVHERVEQNLPEVLVVLAAVAVHARLGVGAPLGIRLVVALALVVAVRGRGRRRGDGAPADAEPDAADADENHPPTAPPRPPPGTRTRGGNPGGSTRASSRPPPRAAAGA